VPPALGSGRWQDVVRPHGLAEALGGPYPGNSHFGCALRQPEEGFAGGVVLVPGNVALEVLRVFPGTSDDEPLTVVDVAGLVKLLY